MSPLCNARCMHAVSTAGSSMAGPSWLISPPNRRPTLTVLSRSDGGSPPIVTGATGLQKRKPHDLATLTHFQVRRVIREIEPVNPNTVVVYAKAPTAKFMCDLPP
jgi:hypothetical protein